MNLDTPELLEIGTLEQDFAQAVKQGLSRTEKSIPPRFLYDARGSELFERICATEDYYVTRTELSLLKRIARELCEHLGDSSVLVEFGAGASRKTRLLLNTLRSAGCEPSYFPIDISREFLLESAETLRRDYPGLNVVPICADFAAPGLERLTGRVPGISSDDRVAGFFPGSTIGNLSPEEVRDFLGRAARMIGSGGLMVVGVDLLKDQDTLIRAYDDRERVTAEFNLNLVRRMRRELGIEIDPQAFRHEARFNAREERIEMHLVALEDQRFEVDGVPVEIRAGESIHTENSYKYRPERFEALVDEAGWTPVRRWTDPKGWFSVYLLRADAREASLDENSARAA